MDRAMRQRRNMDHGEGLSPEQIWAAYRRETYALLRRVLSASRLRLDHAPEEEATPPQ